MAVMDEYPPMPVINKGMASAPTLPIAIPERPRRPPAPAAPEWAQYGVNFWKMTAWASRSDEQRHILAQRLRRFIRWRMQYGDLGTDFAIPAIEEMWAVAPPAAETLILFLGYVDELKQPTRSQHKAMLREYLRRHEEPELFRMVK